MSSLKRKDAPGSKPAAKPPAGEPPSKRPRSDSASKSKDKADKPASAPAAPVVSKLKEDEPLFPRGGGSVLTPLEHKQIKVQASKDVLFEQESGKSKGKEDRAPKKLKGKKSKTQLKELAKNADSVKIESLNFKVSERPNAHWLRTCRLWENILTPRQSSRDSSRAPWFLGKLVPSVLSRLKSPCLTMLLAM